MHNTSSFSFVPLNDTTFVGMAKENTHFEDLAA
jgi:hypothetical protein